MGKTNLEFVKFAESLLSDKADTWYMYGVNGQKITEALIQAKKKQYPAQYTDDKIKILRTKIGKIGYDCSSIADVFTGQDKSADGWLASAVEKGSIETIPELPGVTVHYPGHMGIYIGSGEVIESRGVDYGVVKTKLNARPWTSWGEVPYIDYGRSKDMQKGDKGNDVKLWQARLIQWDKNALPKYGVDGSFGGETVEWTKRFQSKAGLIADGIVGPSTWNAMIDALQGDPAKIIALETRIKALESEVQTKSALVLETNKKIDSARQAINTLKTL